jgi:hypothetical protein
LLRRPALQRASSFNRISLGVSYLGGLGVLAFNSFVGAGMKTGRPEMGGPSIIRYGDYAPALCF